MIKRSALVRSSDMKKDIIKEVIAKDIKGDFRIRDVWNKVRDKNIAITYATVQGVFVHLMKEGFVELKLRHGPENLKGNVYRYKRR